MKRLLQAFACSILSLLPVITLQAQPGPVGDPDQPLTCNDFVNPELLAGPAGQSAVSLLFQDMSDLNETYTIYRTDAVSHDTVQIAVISDAETGQPFEFEDTPLASGRDYRYWVDAMVNCDGGVISLMNIAETVNGPEPLRAPDFTYGYTPTCGNEINFGITDNNDMTTLIEIWRSTDPDADFDLVNTVYGGSDFLDRNLISGGTYFYKLRSVTDIASSQFSATSRFEAGHAYYNPTLTTMALSDGAIEARLTINSRLVAEYNVFRIEEGTVSEDVWIGSASYDSGSTYVFKDVQVIPGRTYTYYTNATLTCDGFPYIEYAAHSTITAPDGPAVFGFALVNPYTDQDVRDFNSDPDEVQQIEYEGKYNIRANANQKTGSVQFFLNDVKHNENQAPYALFGDNNGNYNVGRLKPGLYTLSATAYSGNNGQGTRGNTRSITIQVNQNGTAHMATTQRNTDVEADFTVFPNPVVGQSTINISGEADSPLKVTVIDQLGNSIRTLYNGSLDAAGAFAKELSVNDFQQGTYLVTVTIGDRTFTKRIVVK